MTHRDGPAEATSRDAHSDASPEAGHHGHGGHGGHGGDHVAQFRKLFWINVILGVPVVAFSTMFAMLVGYELPGFPGARWVA
ncbi:MAG: heavy metal translocating P-type ATPase, partial [Dietzia sp.]|nr:heavy metal translocating P-type ATPase [Dietzia sp.]